MTQIINRRVTNVALGTLADNAAADLDAVMETLLEKAFLFEYRANIIILTDDVGDLVSQGGVTVALQHQSLDATESDAVISGSQVIPSEMNEVVAVRQQLFALAEFHAIVPTANDNTNGFAIMNLHFKPKAKGGIPFATGSGWTMRVQNRTGSSLGGGMIYHATIYERFAYAQ